MSFWHKSTERPEFQVAPCVIAMPPDDDFEFWSLHTELHTWHESEGCWIGVVTNTRLQPGEDFRWGYELELFAELEHEADEEPAHV